MPRHTRPTYTALLPVFLLAFLLLSGCRKETQPAQATPDLPEAGSGVYVSITVTADGGFSPSSARTGVPGTRVPNPGEDGDGEQPGTGDENMVHDINVFFLTGNIPDGGSILDDNDARIVASEYFSGDDIRPSASGEITLYTVQREIEGLSVGGQYHALAIVNAGVDLGTRDTDPVETVTDLQDLTFSEVINTVTEEDGTSHRKFLMASADDSGLIEIEPNNSPYNPTVVRIPVERMAARVDCRFEFGDRLFPVDNTNDKVQIIGAAIANKYKQTYAFKRVTANGYDPNSIEYLGKEQPIDGSGVALNYVVDPKLLAAQSNPDDEYASDYTATSWDAPEIMWQLPSDEITSDFNGVTYGLLDYTTENVVSKEVVSSSRKEYCTGVVFKAQYLIDGNATPGEGETTYNVYWYEGNIYSSMGAIEDQLEVGTIDESEYGKYGIRKYPGGICYYTYWIRHADDGDSDAVSPMEYATVRNNIYQLNVNSISGIGGVTPGDEGEIIIKVTLAPWRQEINVYPEF